MARIRAILSSVSVLCIKSAPMLPQESNQILPLKRAEFQRQAARTHRLRIPNTQNHQHLEIQRSNFATASGQESRRNWLARESVRTCVYGPRTKTNARGKEGWIVAFIIIWKGATIRGRVGPFLQILDEREREAETVSPLYVPSKCSPRVLRVHAASFFSLFSSANPT